MDFSKLLYLPLDIPNPPDVTEVLDTISYSDMYVDTYRNCHHIPLMDQKGNWLPLSERVPELVDWCEEHLFTWTDRARIMIITTQPGEKNPPHIDCSPEKFSTWQHKFRYVLQGRTDSLFFIHKDNTERVPQLDKPFIMSGKWPHAMHNDSDKVKYTFALGAPWEPSQHDEKYINMLQKSYNKYKNNYLEYHESNLIADYESLYEEKYLV